MYLIRITFAGKLVEMKKIICFFGVILSLKAAAQMSFPSPELLEEVKSTQTVITLSNAHKVRSEVDMKAIITENWKATTPIIASAGEANKYRKAGYSVLRIETDHYRYKSGNTYYSYNIKFLKLFLFKEKDNKKIKEELVGSIVMPDNFRMTDFLVKTYFQIFNNHISNSAETKIYSVKAKDELRELVTDTLLLPDYILDKFDGVATAKKVLEPKTLLKGYEGKWEILTQEEIDERIETGENKYFFVYVRTEAFKFLMIVNGETGSLLYSEHFPTLVNMTPKNFSSIWKRIASGEDEIDDEESGKKKDKKNKE